MSKTKRQVKNDKYLVYAVYNSMGTLTKIGHVGIVLARSSFSAITIAKRNHNPDGEKPNKYVASLILGPFRVNMFSERTFSCEELLSAKRG